MRAQLILVGMLALPSLALAEAPATVAYQGRLLKADGSPETGIVNAVFKLFDASTAGNLLWTEPQRLGLSDGYYATYLGEVTPLSPTLFGLADVWLELSINDAALGPRQRVGAVPFAMVCGQALRARGGRNLIDWQPVIFPREADRSG